jgi:hypothetical protein
MNAPTDRAMLRIQSSSRNPGARRTILAFVVVIVLVALAWAAWKFQPWMPEGHAVRLESTRLGDSDFQIWQRKNGNVSEPFATALFVRKPGGPWTAYLLGFEDVYRPEINLRREGPTVGVFYGNHRWAGFDQERQVLTRESDGRSLVTHGVLIDSDPPGDWWEKLSVQR